MTNDTIYSRFKEIAEKYPDDPAIIEDDRTVSFSNLDAMADCILAKFYDRIPSPEYVGIVMSHGAEQVAAMLAVLKSGAGYIPAEPTPAAGAHRLYDEIRRSGLHYQRQFLPPS